MPRLALIGWILTLALVLIAPQPFPLVFAALTLLGTVALWHCRSFPNRRAGLACSWIGPALVALAMVSIQAIDITIKGSASNLVNAVRLITFLPAASGCWS